MRADLSIIVPPKDVDSDLLLSVASEVYEVLKSGGTALWLCRGMRQEAVAELERILVEDVGFFLDKDEVRRGPATETLLLLGKEAPVEPRDPLYPYLVNYHATDTPLVISDLLWRFSGLGDTVHAGFPSSELADACALHGRSVLGMEPSALSPLGKTREEYVAEQRYLHAKRVAHRRVEEFRAAMDDLHSGRLAEAIAKLPTQLAELVAGIPHLRLMSPKQAEVQIAKVLMQDPSPEMTPLYQAYKFDNVGRKRRQEPAYVPPAPADKAFKTGEYRVTFRFETNDPQVRAERLAAIASIVREAL